jgi:methylamine dehydrogenase accessory protein MauD
MTEVLLVSNLISWVFLLGLALAVLALARQIGVLHERIKPVGALSLAKVVKAGDAAPTFNLPSLTGGAVILGGNSLRGQSSLLFFLSPSCPVCKVLLPVLKAIQAQERDWLRLVLASDGVENEHLAFIGEHGLETFPYLLSMELGVAYRIGKLPYAVLISADGKVAAHGLVNNREQLESLFEAQALGVSSVQEYQKTSAR